jgi:hypothetical protein
VWEINKKSKSNETENMLQVRKKKVNLKDITMEEKDRWEGEQWLHSQNLLEEMERRKNERIRERILENVCHSFLMPFCSNDQGI